MCDADTTRRCPHVPVVRIVPVRGAAGGLPAKVRRRPEHSSDPAGAAATPRLPRSTPSVAQCHIQSRLAGQADDRLEPASEKNR